MKQKENSKKPLKNAAKIKVSKNGPYLVSGKNPLQKQVIIADSEGTATEWQPSTKYNPQEKYALCRCGKFKNKPFCKSSHYPEAETVEKVHNE